MPPLRYARIVAAAVAFATGAACGNEENPIRWTGAAETRTVAPGEVIRVRLTAEPDGGWYFYSTTQAAGGPTAARIWLDDTTSFRLAGDIAAPPPSSSFDKTFGMAVEKYSSSASFLVPVRSVASVQRGRSEILVSVLYQACNNTICLSPRTESLRIPVRIEPR